LVSLCSVVAAIAAAAAIFPFEAALFIPRAEVKTAAVAAFVTLSDETEAAAMLSAKTSWQGDIRALRALKTDLSSFDLPEEIFEVVTTPARLSAGAGAGSVAFGVPPYLPSSAAPAPAGIVQSRESAAPAFPKADLLNIDVID
jgi:hypothetical protein